jgi:hypothetical protein
MTVQITPKSTQHTGMATSTEGSVAAWQVTFELEEDESVHAAINIRLAGPPTHHEARQKTLKILQGSRSMCDDIAVWGREMARPENERSPTTLAHESARAQRMADFFEDRVTDLLMQGSPCMAHLILAVAVEMARKRVLVDLTAGRPRLASWMRPTSDLPSMQRTVPP